MSPSVPMSLEQQRQVVQALRVAVFSQANPAGDPELLDRLAAAEQALETLSAAPPPPAPGAAPASPATPAAAGGAGGPRARLLSPGTTGLDVKSTLAMQPLPTGIYHLLDQDTDPLLTVTVSTSDGKSRRVKVQAFLEGLSAEAVRTVEIERYKPVTLNLLPTLFPERARAITEVQRATLHLVVTNLDGKPECHDTFPVTCLSRNSSVTAVFDPRTGKSRDLTAYYGAWVTPYAEAVQTCLRRAAGLWEGKMLWGYQQGRDTVPRQVEALYRAVREAGVTYVNSVMDYGAAPGQVTQRTRLPRESLELRCANCMDGTVLFASLLEGASLRPALVLVPGHAFVGWQNWQGPEWDALPDGDKWDFLETTLLATGDFAQARASGQALYQRYQSGAPGRLTLHPVAALRARGIWPME